jgi:hypothetical protein
MRVNAYVHGSGGTVNDIITATRVGMSPPSVYESTPEMAEARNRRVVGVKFTPAGINRTITYPLDNEARANLTSLYSAITGGMIAPDAKMKMPIIDLHGKFHMTLFTVEEIKQLALWAMTYTYQLYDYADRLHLGQVQPGEPWPSNEQSAPRPASIASIFVEAKPQRTE